MINVVAALSLALIAGTHHHRDWADPGGHTDFTSIESTPIRQVSMAIEQHPGREPEDRPPQPRFGVCAALQKLNAPLRVGLSARIVIARPPPCVGAATLVLPSPLAGEVREGPRLANRTAVTPLPPSPAKRRGSMRTVASPGYV